jgi:hypothetical protein
MEFVSQDVGGFHPGIADFDAVFAGHGIGCALDFQAGFGRCRSNQLDHGRAIDEGRSS